MGILLVLLLGILLGFINGFFSTYGKIPSFIVTLATMSIYRGLAFLITNGTPIFSVSPELDPIFYGKFLGYSAAVLLCGCSVRDYGNLSAQYHPRTVDLCSGRE